MDKNIKYVGNDTVIEIDLKKTRSVTPLPEPKTCQIKRKATQLAKDKAAPENKYYPQNRYNKIGTLCQKIRGKNRISPKKESKKRKTTQINRRFEREDLYAQLDLLGQQCVQLHQKNDDSTLIAIFIGIVVILILLAFVIIEEKFIRSINEPIYIIS